MKKGSYICFWLAITSCSLVSERHAAKQLPADKKATKETIALFNNLKRLAADGFMFGHQDDLAYGVNWKYEEGRSDIKEVTGDYPAVYGWELGGIEKDNQDQNLDGVPFEKMRGYIKAGYERGGVITVSWHASSPLGAPKGAWDTTHGTVASILPNGTHHALYKNWLDKVAVFLGSLKGNNGEAIPVLFRPFHEHTGDWFWWCKNACSDEEYKSLWRFTLDYLVNEKELHNLLWVYNTSGNFSSREEFLSRYPGDDYADMLSFDAYQYGDPQKGNEFEVNTNRALTTISQLAAEKNKLCALAETGYEAIPYPAWWTGTLINAIGNNRISYVLVWRNHGYHEDMKKMHYYAPYAGQVSANDFKKFYRLDKTFFEKDISREKIYQ